MNAKASAGDPAENFRQNLINKTVPWKFMGKEMTFDLSHALFSSFDIDAGSKLLLKTAAQRIDLTGMNTILDMGCGIGVLGISLKARFPHLAVTAVDRDALALEMTRYNARKNGITEENSGWTVAGSVGLMKLTSTHYDIIISNIPAKAGKAVIENWLAGFTDILGEKGLLAFVIVKTLEETAEVALSNCGYKTVLKEGTREYCVFHARPNRIIAADRTLGPYRRGRMTLTAPGGPLVMETVTGLPEFDALSYTTALLQKIIRRVECAGDIIIWNPGQGHLAAGLWRRFGRRISRMTLAGRDLLSLEISRHNCLTAGIDQERLAVRHASSLFDIADSYDRIIMVPDADTGVPWHLHLLPAILPRLAEQGTALVAAKSSFLGRVDLAKRTRLLEDLRSKGFRGVAFRA